MKFAEMSQEVMVMKSQQVKFDLGLTPGRRRIGEKIREDRQREAEVKREGNMPDWIFSRFAIKGPNILL